MKTEEQLKQKRQQLREILEYAEQSEKTVLLTYVQLDLLNWVLEEGRHSSRQEQEQGILEKL
jgi:hypothetical protein